MSKLERIDTLCFILAIAFIWAFKTGEFLLDNGHQIPIKKLNKRKAKLKSIFRIGLDFIKHKLLNFLSLFHHTGLLPCTFTVNNIATGQNEVRSVWPVPLFGLNGYDLKYRFNWDTPYFVSPHDAKTIYLGGNVLFKTTDEGLNWEVISPDLTNDIKDRQKITGTPWLSEYFGQEIYSTIKRMDESPLEQGLIWTGSDDGKIFITRDGGGNWEDVSITNGRGFWIMDDITPLREKSAAVDAKAVHLFPVPDHTRFGYNWWMDYLPGGDPGMKKNYFVQNMRPGLTYYELTFKQVNGERKRKFIDAGDPKPLGPVLYFKLAKEPQDITIEILDKEEKVIRNYTKADMVLNYGTEGDINTGLNKFVWDMRINMLPRVPKRPGTTIIPIVPPGEYMARLNVDGVVETQSFNVHMSPKEPYTQEQAEAKFAFWMEMYQMAENYTNKVIEALKVKDNTLAKIESMKSAGASDGKVKKAEEQAAVIAGIVDTYEKAFVSTGRTLAEVINLPATILLKMAFMSGILDHSEGPVSNSMKTEFTGLKKEAKAADGEYQVTIKPALEKFEKLIK